MSQSPAMPRDLDLATAESVTIDQILEHLDWYVSNGRAIPMNVMMAWLDRARATDEEKQQVAKAADKAYEKLNGAPSQSIKENAMQYLHIRNALLVHLLTPGSRSALKFIFGVLAGDNSTKPSAARRRLLDAEEAREFDAVLAAVFGIQTT